MAQSPRRFFFWYFLAGFAACFLLVILLRAVWKDEGVEVVPSPREVASSNAANTSTLSLPTVIGQCAMVMVSEVTTRLQDGITGKAIPGSGSQILYTNGGRQVSYDTIKGIEDSRPGDAVNLCLVSVPAQCPPGDDRGKVYHATNLRTGESWEASDSEHLCGGA